MPFLGKTPSQIVDPEVDIDGGTIDGATIGSITAGAGTFTNLSATGTITFPDDGISGDDINGGTISNFASAGIDDNATSTAITIDSGQNVSLSGDLTVDTDTLYVDSTNNRVGIGEANPSNPLEVVGVAPIRLTRSGLGGPNLEFANDDGVIAEMQTLSSKSLVFIADPSNDEPNSYVAWELDGTERMRIDSTGNVGIGTTTFNLDTFSDPTLAVGSGASGTRGTVEIAADITTNTAYGILAFTNDSSTDTTNNKRVAQINATRNGNNNAADLHFITNSGSSYDTRMSLDASGNVGIGAPAVSGANAPLDVDKATPFNNCVANFGEFVPLSGYQRGVVNINGRVNGTDYPASLSMVVRNSANSNWLHGRIVYNNDNEFVIEKNGAGSTGGTEQFKIDAGGRQTITHNQYAYAQQNYFINSSTSTGNVYLGNINGSFHLASNAYYYGGSLRKLDAGKTDSAGLYLASNGEFYFQQVVGATAGSAANATSVAKIDASGNLLVGASSQVGNGKVGILKNLYNDGAGLAIRDSGTTLNGDYIDFLNSSNSIAGYIRHNGSTTVQYVTSSDVRLKENIVDAPAGNIDAIRVRSFDWKADGSHQTYGVVAQELVDVAPEAVSQARTDDDVWGVDYSKLVPMMIKEIQDLKAEVAALKGA